MSPTRYFRTSLVSLAFAVACLSAGAPEACAAGSPKPPLPGELRLERTEAPGSRSSATLLGEPSLGESPLIVKLRLEDGEELPMRLDTGGAGTSLDESLVPKLGRRLGTTNSCAPFGQPATLGIYAAPKLYAGGTPLVTGSEVYTLRSTPGRAEKGVLGMDCLRHYCIQFDVVAGKLTFLDPEHLDLSELGKPFPLKGGHQGITCFEGDLFAQGKMRFLLDTGTDGPFDGMVAPRVYEALEQKYPTIPPPLCMTTSRGTASGSIFARLNICGQPYTEVRLSMVDLRELHVKGVIGMRFLSRHKVTLNFPGQMLYLKYLSGAPLAASPSTAHSPIPAADRRR